jgi:uncharacterized protein YeaO (DUF488 family)
MWRANSVDTRVPNLGGFPAKRWDIWRTAVAPSNKRMQRRYVHQFNGWRRVVEEAS